MKLTRLVCLVTIAFFLAGCATNANRVALQQASPSSPMPSQFAQPTSGPQTDYNNVDLVALQQQRGITPGSQRSRSRPSSGSS